MSFGVWGCRGGGSRKTGGRTVRDVKGKGCEGRVQEVKRETCMWVEGGQGKEDDRNEVPGSSRRV